VSGDWPDVSGPAYQASKAGMQAFARGAGFEEHENGVRFTTINPGVVDTPILDNRPVVPSPELRARMLAPEDVAAACLFVVGLPPRAHVPELTILPTTIQSLGKPAPAR
jgi:NADP-dependent 3-hydroxy acid dehydrogenase YdfG